MTRTRFAPSPTGYMHIGNARSALFPWLVAKKDGGKFILRIEDTDQNRFVEGAQQYILDVLHWLGLDYDEGPGKDGGYGPYIQSERKDIYRTWAQKLVDAGLAYADPYTPAELQVFREEAERNKKPFLYRNHRPQNPPVWDGSRPLRFKITDIGPTHWHDAVLGDLSAGPEALDDFIILKSDGMPTYNFAHIVDDAEMGITHVIRGSEYVSSTPKYLALYKALGITPPVLASVPHVMAPDGKKKLGKRDGAKDIMSYKADGYIPEAMMNFLALLGWNSGTEQEIYTQQELIPAFSLERVQKSGARFDEKKLLWMNGEYIRRMSDDMLAQHLQMYWEGEDRDFSQVFAKNRDLFTASLPLIKERIKTLKEYKNYALPLFERPTSYEIDITEYNSLYVATAQNLAGLADWNAPAIGECMQETCNTLTMKPKDYFMAMRLIMFGKKITPPLNESMELLSKEEVLMRLQSPLA